MPRQRKSAENKPNSQAENGVAKQAEQEAVAMDRIVDKNIPKMTVEFTNGKLPRITFENYNGIRASDLRRLPLFAHRELQRLRTLVVHQKDKG